MALRIEASSLTVNKTSDPSVVEITADVTKDDVSVENPKMFHVTVLWNINTPRSNIKDAMRAAIKDESLQETLRAAIGEQVIPTPAPGPDPNITINANNVTVNQK